jgi:hypothetical protein
MRTRLAILMSLLVACDGGAARERDSLQAPGVEVSGDSGGIRHMGATVRAVLEIPRVVQAGSRVPLRLRIENAGARPIDLYLRGREVTFDVIVSRASGEEVWQRLRDSIVPAIVQLRALAPGETLTASTTWDQRGNDGAPVGAGEYRLRAVLLLETDSLRSEPVPLTIR